MDELLDPRESLIKLTVDGTSAVDPNIVEVATPYALMRAERTNIDGHRHETKYHIRTREAAEVAVLRAGVGGPEVLLMKRDTDPFMKLPGGYIRPEVGLVDKVLADTGIKLDPNHMERVSDVMGHPPDIITPITCWVTTSFTQERPPRSGVELFWVPIHKAEEMARRRELVSTSSQQAIYDIAYDMRSLESVSDVAAIATYISTLSANHAPREVDVIVAITGDGPGRFVHAANLWHECLNAPDVFITGAHSLLVVGEGKFTKASQYLPILVNAGIPREKIFVDDDEGVHTLGQATAFVRFAQQRMWKTATLVATRFHILRAWLTFIKQVIKADLDVLVMPNSAEHLSELEVNPLTLVTVAGEERLLSGIDLFWLHELPRILAYQNKGDVATWSELLDYLRGHGVIGDEPDRRRVPGLHELYAELMDL